MGFRTDDPIWYRRVGRRWGDYGRIAISWFPATVVGRRGDQVQVKPEFANATFWLSLIDVRPRDPGQDGRDRPDRVGSGS